MDGISSVDAATKLVPDHGKEDSFREGITKLDSVPQLCIPQTAEIVGGTAYKTADNRKAMPGGVVVIAATNQLSALDPAIRFRF